MDQIFGGRVVGVAESIVGRQEPRLEQQVPGRHVGVAVDEVNGPPCTGENWKSAPSCSGCS